MATCRSEGNFPHASMVAGKGAGASVIQVCRLQIPTNVVGLRSTVNAMCTSEIVQRIGVGHTPTF